MPVKKKQHYCCILAQLFWGAGCVQVLLLHKCWREKGAIFSRTGLSSRRKGLNLLYFLNNTKTSRTLKTGFFIPGVVAKHINYKDKDPRIDFSYKSSLANIFVAIAFVSNCNHKLLIKFQISTSARLVIMAYHILGDFPVTVFLVQLKKTKLMVANLKCH